MSKDDDDPCDDWSESKNLSDKIRPMTEEERQRAVERSKQNDGGTNDNRQGKS